MIEILQIIDELVLGDLIIVVVVQLWEDELDLLILGALQDLPESILADLAVGTFREELECILQALLGEQLLLIIHGCDKLVEVDLAWVVLVDCHQDLVDLALLEVLAVLAQKLPQLAWVYDTVPINIDALEDECKPLSFLLIDFFED